MKKLVVLTGAGISAESGIKTFRDSDGLWEGYDINEVATPEAWRKNPTLVLEFYNQRRRNVRHAQPNPAHIGLAKLEEHFHVTIITQNIDDLHERGGSSSIVHLHGEILKMRSERTPSLIYPIYDDMKHGDLAEDGAQLRPHIVWFGEAVPLIEDAALLVAQAEIVAVIGTSMVVYPAAGLIELAGYTVPKFILDKKIPPVRGVHNLVTIEKPAGEGIVELTEGLIMLK